MLAVVKKPRIELSLNGEGAKEALSWLSKKFKVTVIDIEEESIPIEETDFWREMQTNRVGNLLAAARLRKGFTQKQLAEKTGIRQNMISDYEKGRRRLTRQMAAKFAIILGIQAARLQRGCAERFVDSQLQLSPLFNNSFDFEDRMLNVNTDGKCGGSNIRKRDKAKIYR